MLSVWRGRVSSSFSSYRCCSSSSLLGKGFAFSPSSWTYSREVLRRLQFARVGIQHSLLMKKVDSLRSGGTYFSFYHHLACFVEVLPTLQRVDSLVERDQGMTDGHVPSRLLNLCSRLMLSWGLGWKEIFIDWANIIWNPSHDPWSQDRLRDTH